MAKLNKIIKPSLIPLVSEFEGLYVRDLPAKQLQERFVNIQKDMEDKPNETIVALFSNLICDETGETIDEFQNEELILDNLSVKQIQGLLESLILAVTPKGTAQGN